VSVPGITRGEGLSLSAVQYERFADVLDSLSPEEWAAPTDCPGWDVKAVASHVLGGLECVRAAKEFVRQVRAGRRLGFDDPNDGLNALQVREHRDWEPQRIAASLRKLIGPGLRGRKSTPLLLRALVRPRMDVAGRVSLGWILDVIYTRDTFLHRVDVCRATGREMVLDDVERRVLADVAREWAERLGKPVTVELTGPAGGTYAFGGGGERVTYDAVEFARATSGRGDPPLGVRVQY
jgi:uncharacterized protein (TIGR03083 family)